MYPCFAFATLLLQHAASFGRVAYALSLPFSPSRKDQASENTFNFQNINNVTTALAIYTTELSVAGHKFTVLLDTGSSDLWLDTTGIDLSGLIDTGIESSITYLDGSAAQGPVLIGNVTIGSFSTSQAFISATGTNATTNGDKGLLGVGPPLLSRINSDLEGTSFDGSMFLENVFSEDPSLGDFITFALSRSETSGATGGGIFTVGEIASNLTAITSSDKLDVISKDRWTVLMDGMVVNGERLTGNSAFLGLGIQSQNPQQTIATLDTGTSLALIPKVYADAIYDSVPGSAFDAASGLYVVPCDANINVSFVFGGIEYPVHPIDTVQASVAEDGSVACFSGFLPTTVDPRQSTEDFLLGDSFMRNIYAVFNFGSFISGTASPSIQLLSTTDADKAFAEFDTLSAQRNQSLLDKATSPDSSSSLPTSPSSSRDNAAGTLTPYPVYQLFALISSVVLGWVVVL